MGVRLAIDDFGTGLLVARLPQAAPRRRDQDRPLLRHAHERRRDNATIVRSTIDLGRNLGLQVVAEGVETEEVWNTLNELGCTIAQGYYLSRPVPPDELRTWLQDRTQAVAAISVLRGPPASTEEAEHAA